MLSVCFLRFTKNLGKNPTAGAGVDNIYNKSGTGPIMLSVRAKIPLSTSIVFFFLSKFRNISECM
jgi:hypothetical protein